MATLTFILKKFLKTQKWSLLVWTTCMKRNFTFFQNSISIGELHLSQAFWQNQARPILIPYESRVIQYLKWVIRRNFYI
jgi:hypothetical protein